jgi:hypothetical protein
MQDARGEDGRSPCQRSFDQISQIGRISWAQRLGDGSAGGVASKPRFVHDAQVAIDQGLSALYDDNAREEIGRDGS